nr:hypothetical protein [Salinisphaera sp. G21_0]
MLDCTLRDGGYYNNWDFEADLVNKYLKAVSEAKIDYVELGLRNFPKDTFLGPFAYTTDMFLNSLELPEGPTYGVMIDAKTIFDSKYSVRESVDKLFSNSSDSKVDLVRIAAHFAEVEKSQEIVKILKEKGYLVGFNLMQAGGKPDSIIEDKVGQIKNWGRVDVLYFADSFGNMDRKEVQRIARCIHKIWKSEVGIHTHNNMAKALDNTFSAIEAGVSWLDVTVTGMGRGAGNAQTENLLAAFSKISDKYSADPVYELVIKYFDVMQKRYGWGSNLLYFIGAQNDIHPTYVQKLISDDRYGPDEIIGAIKYLSKVKASSYTGQLLEEALELNAPENPLSGSDLLKNRFEGQKVLIVGSGPSIIKYKDGIEDYIKVNNPVVIAININSDIDEKLVDFYCVSHNAKFLSEQSKYLKIKTPLILPRHRFTEQELSAISSESEIFDYGLVVDANRFEVLDKSCRVPYEITAGYVIAVAINGNANSIELVGFDGYDGHDPRQSEMLDIFVKINNFNFDLNIVALTPTSYPVRQGSIYAPNI